MMAIQQLLLVVEDPYTHQRDYIVHMTVSVLRTRTRAFSWWMSLVVPPSVYCVMRLSCCFVPRDMLWNPRLLVSGSSTPRTSGCLQRNGG